MITDPRSEETLDGSNSVVVKVKDVEDEAVQSLSFNFSLTVFSTIIPVLSPYVDLMTHSQERLFVRMSIYPQSSVMIRHGESRWSARAGNASRSRSGMLKPHDVTRGEQPFHTMDDCVTVPTVRKPLSENTPFSDL